MAFPDDYSEIKSKISQLTDIFFQPQTDSRQRKRIIAALEQYPEYLSGALFGIIGHPYEFLLGSRPYTLEYYSHYHLETFTSQYSLSLYAGNGDGKKLLRREYGKSKSAVYTQFLKLVDAVRDGTFSIDTCGIPEI